MCKVLVTGADGFIGSHLTEMLVREGYDARAFVLYNSHNSWGWLDHVPKDIAGQFEVVSGDIRDPHGIAEAMKDVDIVLHLAALIAIPFSYHSPDTYVQTNVSGTLNVLQAARRLGTSRVISTSTSEVYGTARFVPITEEHPLNAQSPYAATKVAADQLVLSFHRSFETPVAVLRPFNTYGPRQSARAVIPTIISQIASGSRQIKLGALSPTRDFTFVRDTARGFIQAMGCDATLGRVTNIGSGFEISIADTVNVIAEAMGVSVEVVLDEERVRPQASEVERLFAGTEVATRLFNWNPQFGGRDGFVKGLAETAEWFQNPANLSVYKADRYNI
ncbi:NAD-dependent 4,6-dehydratase LegB [Cypionkella sp.]|uniref:NAD-dependent 4,6-dehydratase LegB n=1 Tax=Cypionkella sp. TaxID=2811411 RepID=UPI000BCA3E1D|nr:NAD-dependent 4,6-dehydratase LegB [Cypionkella sp.]MDO8982385.1 NAD-dependent 4,6-dehydratase LegB [Cypionkella sp.]MDP2050635.1 NAD-dependent 4,6-dehydratase LegB [Cypionkella sp.]OZA19914.1 MAG: NAD-dependent dehydratase [Rhodobacterales bacterium 17-64-5]